MFCKFYQSTSSRNPCSNCPGDHTPEECLKERRRMIENEKIIHSEKFRTVFAPEVVEKMIRDFYNNGHFTLYDDLYDPKGRDSFNLYGINRATKTEYSRLGVKKDELFSFRQIKGVNHCLIDENGFYLGLVDSDSKDKDGFRIEEYRPFSLNFCTIMYPVSKPTDVRSDGFNRNGIGPHGEDRFGFTKKGYNIRTKSKKDENGFYYSGINDEGLDRSGFMPEQIEIAKKYIDSDSLSIQDFCAKENLGTSKTTREIKEAIKMLPPLKKQLEDGTLHNLHAVKQKTKDFERMIDGKLPVEETMCGTNINRIYTSFFPLSPKIASKCIDFMKANLDDPKRIAKFLTGDSFRIDDSIIILKTLSRNIKNYEKPIIGNHKCEAIRSIISGLGKYQGDPSVLIDTTIIKDGKSFHFTREIIDDICKILRRKQEIVCPRNITEYAFGTL